ncbi:MULTISPECIES: hydrogenase formation protein HypD [Acidobacterium]|uniref:Hydrogenase expression/formation protein HypD n=1 Tax=Acidobacterium capsulatum (strain ATCC 51196 / DSM 11244 / BCRC 80197 / JCM 7670 / NBRC 15755 / NCIMB 13165 / 161) TaxID=240015 RepID=C1F4L6_ACIC5|nr:MULTISPECIES: hydrogenase formation protein HypD [Acidobacterium]ACO33945.1 hydrogenase expression/formation protein HypD [Acidobacterium capsulatum ATCC 51196]HCT61832.1 hydrogenase formation protein HypD [Acidobacterium sp.]
MKFVDEYRNGDIAAKLVQKIRSVQTKPWVIMEVCGGQTHSIVKNGIDHLLPAGIELVHGPGCPVCVTPLEMIDRAHAIARRPDTIFCSFGDMLRVPGTHGDLFSIKSQGGDVRVVYSPLDCLKIAQANPDKQVVFFAIGFETTAPANAMLAWRAKQQGLDNISLLISQVLVPPAIESILGSPQNRVQAFLGPGHVCTVVGYAEYEPLSAHFRVPIVVTGFEPLDILEGVLMAVEQLETGRYAVENQYSRVLDRTGNRPAQALIAKIFEVSDRKWRGVGNIPQSGLRLRDEFRDLDAELRFQVSDISTMEPEQCIAGQILQGIKRPHDCPAFGTTCTPQHPLGATMVSAEGACAAYYAYGRHLKDTDIVTIGETSR